VERAPPGGLAGEGIGLQEVRTPGELRGEGAAGKARWRGLPPPGNLWAGRAKSKLIENPL
jgi:hypothetical protein